MPYKESDWVMHYRDVADHLLRGAKMPVSGEDGRRVITVLETVTDPVVVDLYAAWAGRYGDALRTSLHDVDPDAVGPISVASLARSV